MGISEAFYIPAALALIADFHTGHTRSRAVGLHQMGIYVGVIIGGFGGYAADHPALGWRWAFDACGVVGILYAVPLFLLLRNAPRAVDGIAPARPSPAGAVRELAANPSFVLLVLYFTLPALAGWVVRDWMPAILKAEFNIGQGKAGVSATLYWQTAAIVGRARRRLAGRSLDAASPRADASTSAPSACRSSSRRCSASGTRRRPACCGWRSPFSSSSASAGASSIRNNMPILCQIARPELRATGYGIMNLVSISCGGFADWGFGALRDRHVPLFGIFGVFASAAIISIVLVLLIRPRYTEPSVGSSGVASGFSRKDA